MSRRLVARLLLPALVVTACAGGSGIHVESARLGAPAGPNGAIYLTIVGGDADDRLIGATTDAASAVEIHRVVVKPDGGTGMEKLDGLDVPAGEELVLAPGGYHLMLLDVDRLGIGDVVELTLIWETAGEMIVEANVVDPSDVMEEP